MSRRGYNQVNEVYTIIKIDTTKTSTGGSDSNSVKMPFLNFSGIVDFGDGTIQDYAFSALIVITHTYAVSGIYTIKIRITDGNYTQFFYNNSNANDRLKLVDILRFGKLYIGSSSFYGCVNLKMDAVVGVPLTVNNNMFNAFRISGVSTIKNIHLWNVSNVISMNNMFTQATLFNQDISGWNFNKDVDLTNFMVGKSSANYSAVFYSNLLIKVRDCVVETGRTNATKGFTMQNIKYDSTGASARADLVADGWTITDGGMI